MGNSANCQVTDKGARQLTQLKELVELRIGTLASKLVGNNDGISGEVFTEVLLNLKQLTVLDMLLPKVKELVIGKYATMQGARIWGQEEQNTWQGTSSN